MITETIEHESHWERLFEQLAQHSREHDDSGQLIGHRLDVAEAMNFMVLDLNGNALIGPDEMALSERFIVNPLTRNVYTAISLFWSMYEPWMAVVQPISDTVDDFHRQFYPPAPTSAELDGLLLQSLDWIYDRFRVTCEPDADDSPNLLDLVTELHICAARAFKLKQLEADWLSEERETCLRAAEGLVNRIRAIMRPRTSSRYDSTSFAMSTSAVGGMIQLELSRVCRANGSYAEAIHHLDQASTSYIWALDGIEDSRGSDAYWIKAFDRDRESTRNGERLARLELRRRLIPLEVSAREAAAPFNLLKESPPSDAIWRQVAEDCRGLAILPDLEWEVFSGVEASEYVEDPETCFELSWSEFWYQSAAWASAQLGSNEFRQELRAVREEAAEHRLGRYFFTSTWSSLPEGAQERLVSADVNWNSRQRVSRESILNDLLRASEEMCERFLYEQVMNDEGVRADVVKIEARVAERGYSSPGVNEYISICNIRDLPESLENRGLIEDEIQFVTQMLPSALDWLRVERNRAEHEVGSSVPRERVNQAFRRFLGIDELGSLPELARIGAKLERDSGV